jgi:hypothetical protein
MKGKHYSAHHDMHAHVKHQSMKSMRAHHAKGGKVEEGFMVHDETPSDVYAGKDSPTEKEASAHKRGGKVKHVAKHAAKHVAMHGEHAKHRLDRPARKSGGRIGCEMSPMSSASNVKTPAGRDVDTDHP